MWVLLKIYWSAALTTLFSCSLPKSVGVKKKSPPKVLHGRPYGWDKRLHLDDLEWCVLARKFPVTPDHLSISNFLSYSSVCQNYCRLDFLGRNPISGLDIKGVSVLAKAKQGRQHVLGQLFAPHSVGTVPNRHSKSQAGIRTKSLKDWGWDYVDKLTHQRSMRRFEWANFSLVWVLVSTAHYGQNHECSVRRNCIKMQSCIWIYQWDPKCALFTIIN